MTSVRKIEGHRLPPRLADLQQPPRVLYVTGELPRGPIVAVVGTRHPTDGARAFASKLAAELSEGGVTVASGGAEGIDTAAHEGALQAGVPTLVVAPAGILHPFPAMNSELFTRVIEAGGAYLSLVPPKQPASNPQFFSRNAVLAALADAVVVVEAPYRSGARNTAKWGRQLGRPVFAVPAVPWNRDGIGCILELQLGARPLRAAGDVLRLLAENMALVRAGRGSPVEPAASTEPAARQTLPVPVLRCKDPDARRIAEAVASGADSLEGLCSQLGLSVAVVQHLVLTLTLEGVLVADSAGGIRIVSL